MKDKRYFRSDRSRSAYVPLVRGLRIPSNAHTDYSTIFAPPKYHFFPCPSMATSKQMVFVPNFTGLCIKVFSIYN